MSYQAIALVDRPAHVPLDRVVLFDLFNIPGADHDLESAYRAFQQQQPDIFWTPYNGGHWVATRAEDIEVMQRDYTRFSQRRVAIPKSPDSVPAVLPLESDPPRHTDLRRPLTQALMPNTVARMEPKIRELAISLIEELMPRGECEFVTEFAGVLPIMVFLDLVELPRSDAAFLVPTAHRLVRARTAEARAAAQTQLADYLTTIVRERRQRPGTDLISDIGRIQVEGRSITEAETVSYATLLLLAGLDTTVSALALTMRFLASNEEHRRQLIDRLEDGPFLRHAIEELLRHQGVANSGREIAYDFDYKGMTFKKGEMILLPTMLFGLDERRIEHPLAVDFGRQSPIPHLTFGAGHHVCPGSVLARRELLILLQEWLARIPDFAIKSGSEPTFVTGMINAVVSMQLTWAAIPSKA